MSASERYALFDVHREAARVVALGAAGARTLAELRADAERAAGHLSAVPAGCSVLIACNDRYAFATALLAAWARGCTVALPPSHHAPVLAALAREPSIAAVFHDGELTEPVATRALDLRELLGGDSTHVPLPDLGALDGAAHAVTLYTSGTTGEQQAVQKTAKQLLGEVEVLAQCFGAGTLRVACTLPSRHIYGLLFGLLLPLRTGGAFVRETPLHENAVRALVDKLEVDTLVAVPAHLQGIPAAGALAPCVKRVFSSGAPLRAETFEGLCALSLTVIEVLGSTETGGIGYRTGPRDAYLPFPGVTVAAGAEGRLLLSSPRLAPELAQPHACEDIVELTPEGAFVHVGRADDVVKVGGTRVSLSAVERAVRGLAGVRDAAVIARELPGARAHEILLAVAGEGWDAASMRSALRERLAPIALPRRYRFVPELPREATGKLRRDSVLALFAAQRDEDAEEERAVTQLERGASTRERDDKGERVRVALRVPDTLLYFEGHFEGWPVLPGVVQLGLIAVGEALTAWPELGGLRRVRRLKMKRPIPPGASLALELSRPSSHEGEHARVDFVLTLAEGGELCSSGSLAFGASHEAAS